MPKGSLHRLYWDACVPLSYIDGVSSRMEVIELLLNAAAYQRIEIVTSVMSVAEVAYSESEKQQLRESREASDAIDMLWASGSITLAEAYEFIVMDARALIKKAMLREWRLTTVDAVHLATAARLSVDVVHTYDRKLFKFSQFIGIPITEPDLVFLPHGVPAPPVNPQLSNPD